MKVLNIMYKKSCEKMLSLPSESEQSMYLSFLLFMSQEQERGSHDCVNHRWWVLVTPDLSHGGLFQLQNLWPDSLYLAKSGENCVGLKELFSELHFQAILLNNVDCLLKLLDFSPRHGLAQIWKTIMKIYILMYLLCVSFSIFSMLPICKNLSEKTLLIVDVVQNNVSLP